MAELVKVDAALNSMRDSGFDLSAAIGEVVDNSIQAGAKVIKIETGYKERSKKGIDKIIISDDGDGISPKILPNTLTLGYSSRYNSRKGMGRFGMGMKIAGISLGKKIEVYTKVKNDSNIYYSYIDLDEITTGSQSEIQLSTKSTLPEEYKHLISLDDEKSSGTIVIWSKIDRVVNGGTYGNSTKRVLDDLIKFLGRAYRYFLNNGINIFLDNEKILVHDPLFLLDNQRVNNILKDELSTTNTNADVIDSTTIKIDGHDVELTVTLLPEIFRKREGDGGWKGEAARFKSLGIKENEGKISIVRQGREITYGIIPRMLDKGVQDIDRFIGIEVKFPAELDEYFQVRHIKRGAEPVDRLKDEIKIWLVKPIDTARKRIRTLWLKKPSQSKGDLDSHIPAMDAVLRAEVNTPVGPNKGITEEQEKQVFENLIEDIGIDKEKEVDVINELNEEFNKHPFMIMNSPWPGKELIDIEHLNDKAIMKMNSRHPFYNNVYSKLENLSIDRISDMNYEDIASEIQSIRFGIDALFLAYAKAENMNPSPNEAYEDLRSYWGMFASAYINELIKNI